jgi:hypothetical protein
MGGVNVKLHAFLTSALYSSVFQTVVHGGFRRKITAKIVSDTEGMEDNPYMPVLKLILMVDLQQKVGELVLSITSCPTIISLENTLN